jgi:hypothetical protein
VFVSAGKIRVYVRVRPFSKSEAAKNCEESVVKDGKMTVLVKGLGGIPDAKKYYDFDQVRRAAACCCQMRSAISAVLVCKGMSELWDLAYALYRITSVVLNLNSR